jgi:hypothetical protein
MELDRWLSEGINLFPPTHDRTALFEVQRTVAAYAETEDRFDEIRTIAGVDQAFFDDKVISGIVTLDYRTMEEKDHAYTIETIEFPYISTFLMRHQPPEICRACNAYRCCARYSNDRRFQKHSLRNIRAASRCRRVSSAHV